MDYKFIYKDNEFFVCLDSLGGKCLYQLKVEAMQKFSGWAMCGIQFLYDENFTWGNTTVTVNGETTPSVHF